MNKHSINTSKLELPYYPPYDWQSILKFLMRHTIKNVELITAELYYARTVQIGKCKGWIKVSHTPQYYTLQVEFTDTLTAVLPEVLNRLKCLFDLSAKPDLIAAHLTQDERIKKLVEANCGLRVPGAFDGFCMAVRAILGQQISVKAATTLACRLNNAFGEKFDTPFAELNRLSITPEALAELCVDDIAKLGVISARAKCIIALAQACLEGKVQLEIGSNPDDAIIALVKLPGIGPWTAQYIAMRALNWSDAFLKEDIAIQRSLGGVTAKEAETISQIWRPWRSYAVMHIWMNYMQLISCAKLL